MKKLLLALFFVCVIPVGCVANAETGELIKVVDGDTLKLAVAGVTKNYRLAGVDTPEVYNNSKAKKDITACGIDKELMFELGKLGTNYVKSVYTPGDEVSFEIIDTGYYNRPIILVEPLISGLVINGYARVVDYNNIDDMRMSSLKELESFAIGSNLGIWKYLDCWKPEINDTQNE